MFTTFVGILSGILLALSGIPQAVQAVRSGNSQGVTYSLCFLIIGGISTLSAYVFLRHGFDPVLHGEHAISISVWLVILRYRAFPRSVATGVEKREEPSEFLVGDRVEYSGSPGEVVGSSGRRDILSVHVIFDGGAHAHFLHDGRWSEYGNKRLKKIVSGQKSV